jgi:hypothetical protein
MGTGYARTSISFLVALGSAALLLAAANAAPPPTSVVVTNTPLPVTLGETVQTETVIPSTAFSTVLSILNSPATLGVISGPDPAGTSYAITSVTVTNYSGDLALVGLTANYGTTSDCKTFQERSFGDGPLVFVPPSATTHLAFPQPVVLPKVDGKPTSCLNVSGPIQVNVVVVGYRL